MRAPAGPPPPDAGLPDASMGSMGYAPPPNAPPPKMKKKKKSKDSLKAEGIEKKKKKKKKKSRSSKRFAGAVATNPLTARARARLLCRAMELRISIARYYCQEAAYLDKVRGRATVNVGAFHETEDWRHGKKVLSALGAMAVPRRMPEELAHSTIMRAPAGPPPPDADGSMGYAPPPNAPPPKMKKKKKSKDSLAGADPTKKKKKKKKKSRTSKRFAGAAATNPLTARARARLLCRAMELRISIARYY